MEQPANKGKPLMNKYKIQRYKITCTIPADDNTIVEDLPNLNGYLVAVQANVPALVGTTTLTISITDQDGYTIYSKSGIAEGARFIDIADSNNVLRKIPLSGTHQITCTASNIQTSTQAPIPIVLKIEKGV